MATADQAPSAWRKASFSGAQSNCIEVSDRSPGPIPVRDSKHPAGPVLVFERAAWSAFLLGIKAGDFPHS
ncbi:DUF397 domain-containing protein [Kitasatospora sp. NPDC093806]|uniref:DUF397 domain-containing protein n=1 Tax=Kitasatospora sp. NPDC093806 TaxID=3155075 RepID=UPI0034297CB7